MTAYELEDRGFKLSIEVGRLIVNPSSKLTPELREAIKANRDAIYREIELVALDDWFIHMLDTGALDGPNPVQWLIK